MKPVTFLLTAALLLGTLSGCAAPAPVQTTAPEATGEALQSGILYADFSYGVSDADAIREYPAALPGNSPQDLAEGLSCLTGLDFRISAAQTPEGWVIDWSPRSTLVAGLDDRAQKEEFFFQDIDTLRWFMLDSLWRTLTHNLNTDTIFYTMDGGRELVLEELSWVSAFPADVPYLGSPFYFAHHDGRGDGEEAPNTYFDAATGLLLSYPNVFSAQASLDENGVASFYTLWDTGMLYWTDPNDAGHSPGQFREVLAPALADTMELTGNVVIGYGQIQDAQDRPAPGACYWVVDTDRVVNVMILCADLEEAAYWYQQFQDRAFWVESAAGVSPLLGCWAGEEGAVQLRINQAGQAWYLSGGEVLFRGYVVPGEEEGVYLLYNEADVVMETYRHDPGENRLLVYQQGIQVDTYDYQGPFSLEPG